MQYAAGYRRRNTKSEPEESHERREEGATPMFCVCRLRGRCGPNSTLNAVLLPALVLGSALAAQGAGKIVLMPGIDTPGVVSEVTDLRIAADKAAELARLAPRVSTRLYAGRKAHVFHTSFAQAAWLGMHVKRVSIRDSGLLVRIGGQEREAVWPARA